MQIQQIILIIGAGVLALLIALFQYLYKAKSRSRRNLFFAFLRFLSVFSLLLLLIDPTFTQNTYINEKPTLLVAVDNSSSLKHLKQDQILQKMVQELKDNTSLNERFDIDYYAFSDALKDSLSLDFTGKQTNIYNTIDELNQIYKSNIAPVVLLTDGNQTYGKEYQFKTTKHTQQVFPVILGDTTIVEDLKIEQLNVNRYVYLKNKFPVELILSYSGDNTITTSLEILSGTRKIYNTTVSFSKEENSKVIKVTLPTIQPGVFEYKARLVPLDQEKNTINNTKNFAVEVIDQKTNVLLVSRISHPDLGALKKSIESNERRSVTIVKPSDISKLDEYQLIVIYQPDATFRKLYEELKTVKKNVLTITGTKTNWNFLNQIQAKYTQAITGQTENYTPRFNANYSAFLLEDIGFDKYPPLLGNFGDIRINVAHDILLYRSISGIETNFPLLCSLEDNGIREAVLLGENIWRWRANDFLLTNNFESFDNFLGKLVQYLASNKKKSRLTTYAEPFYYGNTNIKIKAAYFTKNYEFDRRASVSIRIENKNTNSVKEIPMLLRKNAYQVDVSDLPAGSYTYSVHVAGENLSRSGNFTVLEYNVEQQFLNADVTKLKQLATNTGGKSYYIHQKNQLLDDLIHDDRYQIIQKKEEKVISLIDWKYLVLIIVGSLAIEWFMRKYNGLI